MTNRCKPMSRLTLILAVVMFLPACALTTAKLDLAHDSQANVTGPLSIAPSQRLVIHPLADQRPDPERIGYKKNGYGRNMADIVSVRPIRRRAARVSDRLIRVVHRDQEAADTIERYSGGGYL